MQEAIRLDPEDPTTGPCCRSIHLDQRLARRPRRPPSRAGPRPRARPGQQPARHRPRPAGRRARPAPPSGRPWPATRRTPSPTPTRAGPGCTRGDFRGALEHFREALRLNPSLEWARAGLVEALKARYPVYGLLLRYFLWMSTLSRRAQWAVILGACSFRALRAVATNNPALAPWITPLLVL